MRQLRALHHLLLGEWFVFVFGQVEDMDLVLKAYITSKKLIAPVFFTFPSDVAHANTVDEYGDHAMSPIALPKSKDSIG